MEQNLPVKAKKVWNLIRVMFFMLKKSISKAKLFADLNMLIKRGKLAGKSIHNLFFHHHHNWAAATYPYHPHQLPYPTPQSGEYEFSCKDTPPYSLSMFSSHKKNQNKHQILDNKQANKHTDHRVYKGHDVGKSYVTNDNDIFLNATVMKALEDMLTSGAASPGYVNSPVVKQLRITDSPFPLSNSDEDGKVDEAADKFIKRFYNDLRRQN